MSWFSDAVNTVADAVSDAANAVGEIVSDAVETVGNAVEDALDWVGADVPGWSHFTGWIGSIVSGITDLIGAVVKAITGIIGGVIGGVIRIVGGIVSGNGGLIKQGFGDIISSIVGAVIVVVLRAIALVQQIIPFQARERRMTKDEITDMKRVFGESLAYYNIRIVEGRAGIFLGPRELVVGNTIYMKDHDPDTERERLAHECVHVWQYQNRGSRYASDALYAQLFVDDQYSWEKELDRGKEEWVEFNIEAQGKFIQNVYFEGELIVPGVNPNARGNGVFFDANEKTVNLFEFGGSDHTDLANEAWSVLKNEGSQRLSNFFD
jgi:uncharacterized membrane protein YeaQ/YmgE (transglycosylase-associated protein family)